MTLFGAYCFMGLMVSPIVGFAIYTVIDEIKDYKESKRRSAQLLLFRKKCNSLSEKRTRGEYPADGVMGSTLVREAAVSKLSERLFFFFFAK